MLFSYYKLNAQVPVDSLIGKWQLVALQGKQISDHELMQKYIFMPSGEFTYISFKRTIKGKYTLEPKTGKMSWEIESGKFIWFESKLEPNGTLIFKQAKHSGAPGILSRMK